MKSLKEMKILDRNLSMLLWPEAKRKVKTKEQNVKFWNPPLADD